MNGKRCRMFIYSSLGWVWEWCHCLIWGYVWASQLCGCEVTGRWLFEVMFTECCLFKINLTVGVHNLRLNLHPQAFFQNPSDVTDHHPNFGVSRLCLNFNATSSIGISLVEFEFWLNAIYNPEFEVKVTSTTISLNPKWRHWQPPPTFPFQDIPNLNFSSLKLRQHFFSRNLCILNFIECFCCCRLPFLPSFAWTGFAQSYFSCRSDIFIDLLLVYILREIAVSGLSFFCLLRFSLPF